MGGLECKLPCTADWQRARITIRQEKARYAEKGREREYRLQEGRLGYALQRLCEEANEVGHLALERGKRGGARGEGPMDVDVVVRMMRNQAPFRPT